MKVANLIGPLLYNSEIHRFVYPCRYDLPPKYAPNQMPHNQGDWFVTRAMTDIIDAEEVYNIYPNASQKEFDIINNECDILILKGGNFLSGDWIHKEIGLETLKKIKLPIVYVGAGLQAPIGGKVTFIKEEIECLKYIHDNCHSSSVRGNSTAEALNEIGIKNVEVIGCPTLYWGLKRNLKIKKATIENVAWTMRDYLFSQGVEMHAKQFQLMNFVRNFSDNFQVMLQGEEVELQEYFQYKKWGTKYHTEKIIFPGNSGIYKTQKKYLSEDEIKNSIYKKYGNLIEKTFLNWIMNHTFFSYDTADYIDFFKSLTLAIGCRLHGNLVSLAHGTPAYYVTYDERTEEMVRLFNIPGISINNFNYDPQQILNSDWTKFENKYKEYYDIFLKFLENNNIKNNLEK